MIGEIIVSIMPLPDFEEGGIIMTHRTRHRIKLLEEGERLTYKEGEWFFKEGLKKKPTAFNNALTLLNLVTLYP